MQSPVASIRYTLRQFKASPVFTAAAVLTLALGIGGTTAIFTLIHAVMLRSLPVADPESLYRIGDGDNCCVQGGPQDRWGMFSFPLFERIKADAPEFEQLTAFQAGGSRVSVRRPGVDVAARSLRTEYVTGNYFTTFGIGAFGGRVFTQDDDTPASPPVVVISHHSWEATYGGDKGLVGGTLVIEGHPFTVAGVAPPGFFGDTLRNNPPDLWIPLQQEPLIVGANSLLRQPVSAWLRVIGRLKPGATTDGVGPRLTGLLRQWIPRDAGWPANWLSDVEHLLPKQTISIVPAGAGVGVMKEQYASSLRLLMAVCALVLLIACANVANLLLARSAARRTQTAVRLAIGASRAQIVTQALVESILLSLAGGIAGLLVATATARLLLSLAFSVSTFLPISTLPSPLVLAFAFGVSLLTGIVFGAVPAWLATRTNPIEALRGSGRSTTDRSSVTRTSLLVLQATLSVVLVAGATMLGRSLNNIEHQDFGYTVPDRMLVAINRPSADYTVPQLTAMYRALEERLNRVPGVQSANLALYNPLTDNWGELVLVAGHPPPKPGDNAGASWVRVSAHYLQNLGMTMVRGRAFTDADSDTTAPVAIVNEAFAKRFFKSDEDPIGQHFGLDEPQNVAHVHHRRHRPRRTVAELSGQSSRAPDVLRPAGAEREVHGHHAACRVPVALHQRADAGDEAGARGARTARDEGDGRRRSESDVHERADARAADRADLRSGPRRREPRRSLRRGVAGAGGDRVVWRDGLLGHATHERDRDPDGARRRHHERRPPGAARRLLARRRSDCCSGCRSRSAQDACSRRSSTASRSGIRWRWASPQARLRSAR